MSTKKEDGRTQYETGSVQRRKIEASQIKKMASERTQTWAKKFFDGDEAGANAGRPSFNFSNMTLAGQNLSELLGVSLDRDTLNNTDFSGTVIVDLSLRGATLHDALFRGAILTHVQFQGADLRGSDFSGAQFDDTTFHGADLRGCNFSGTDLAYDKVTLDMAKYDETTIWPERFTPELRREIIKVE